MKKILLIALLAFTFTNSSQAQSSDTYEFCLVTCYEKFNWLTFESHVVARVEYGDEAKFIQESTTAPYPTESRQAWKNAKKFTSVISVFNYMSLDNWEYVEALLVTTDNQHVYRWLLKRKK